MFLADLALPKIQISWTGKHVVPDRVLALFWITDEEADLLDEEDKTRTL